MNRYRISLFIVILIALALRLYNLTYHSLWFDEAVSVHWAKQDVPRILEVGFTLVEDRLPPLYYLTLKGWTILFGFGEASVRGLSVVFGVLLIPVITSISKLLFNGRIAVFAAALTAINPFLIWYSQEARMYALAVFFGSLSIIAFLRICKHYGPDSAQRGNNLTETDSIHANNLRVKLPRGVNHSLPTTLYVFLFILAAIAALYNHLYAGFLFPALGLWLVISYPRHWQLWFIFGLSMLIITAAYAPILNAIWNFSSEAAPGDPLIGIGQRMWWLLQSFTTWKAPLTSTLKSAISGMILLFAVATYLKPKSPQQQSQIPNPRLLISLLFIFPFIIANILLFRNQLAFFGERYFIVMVPWLLILTAVGVNRLGQWLNQWQPHPPHPILNVGNLLIVVIIPIMFIPVPGQWSISAAKESWRQSVKQLARQATSNDGILIHPDWVRFPFQYYFQGPGQTYAAFSQVSADTALDGPLQGVVANHEVIWLVQSHLDGPDPEQRVEQWFAARYPLVTELYPPGVTIKGYAPGYQLNALPDQATPINITFENGVQLAGYQTERVVSATDSLFHPPSGWIHVILYWRTNQLPNNPATPVIQLVGPEGIWGVSLNRPNDAFGFYSLNQVPASESTAASAIIRHDLDINLNPATPPGNYQLVVGFSDGAIQYPLTQIEVR